MDTPRRYLRAPAALAITLFFALFATSCDGGGAGGADLSESPDMAPRICVLDVDTFDNGCLLAP
jgi:hypothetical protein